MAGEIFEITSPTYILMIQNLVGLLKTFGKKYEKKRGAFPLDLLNLVY